MPRKRKTRKRRASAQFSDGIRAGGKSEPGTSDQRASGSPKRRRYIGWFAGVATGVVITVVAALVVPPVRHLFLPPKLEWIQIGPAVRMSNWVSLNLVERATGRSSEIHRVDTPVYMLPVRLRARRGNLDLESCDFTQGDPSSNHLFGTPALYRMQGDATSQEELEGVCDALLAHDLADLGDMRARLEVKADMPNRQRHLERYRALQHRIAATPVTLRQDEPTPFLLVCVPRLYTGDRDYLAEVQDLSAEAQVALYSRQQEELKRLATEAFTFRITTNCGQVLPLSGHIQPEE